VSMEFCAGTLSYIEPPRKFKDMISHSLRLLDNEIMIDWLEY
jgi:hypothetical protein